MVETRERRSTMVGRECSVPDCHKERYKRDYCNAHYLRWKRHGNPLAGGPTRTKPTVDRFWSLVDMSGPVPAHAPGLGACWIWQGLIRRDGYGSTRLPGFRQQLGAHRAAWWLVRGEMPPDGFHLDHLCRTPRCCNPTHLEPVMPAENNRRSRSPSAINSVKTHCRNGHEFTPENTRINRGGDRVCRRCHRERARRYKEQARQQGDS